MLIPEFLNKDASIVPEEAHIIILDSKSSVCMSDNGKDTKRTRYISRRVNFVINVEKNIHKIGWCEVGL